MSLKLSSASITALATLVFVSMSAPAALAGPAVCSFDEQCRIDQSCVEGRCWELKDGVPANCVSFVTGSSCQSPGVLFEEADLMCSGAGGSLNEQVYADACGAERYESALNLCCTGGSDGEIVTGTNVAKLRERLKKKAIDDTFGCAAGGRDSEIPMTLLASLLALGLVLKRRQTRRL